MEKYRNNLLENEAGSSHFGAGSEMEKELPANNLPEGLEVEGWMASICERSGETREHIIHVTDVTVKLARLMGISENEIPYLRNGAFLHDVGNIGIPAEILQKPGTLTAEEWSLIRQHPRFAYDLLYPVEYLRPSLPIPYSHHEQWGGSGYPQGLFGEDIPLAARIFAVVDTWEALSNDHPYRLAWEQAEILKYIKNAAGSQFDPLVTEAFLEMVA